MSNRLNASYIDKIQNNVLATMAIEGLKPSESAVAINRQFLEGKIDSKKAVKQIIQKYRSSIGGNSDGRQNKNRK